MVMMEQFGCGEPITRNNADIFLFPALDDESIRGSMPAMGRITGSASIETLVRVGIEKENGFRPDSKMVVVHDFMPCVDDELEVKRGQVVNVLYPENDWVYVVSEEDKEGFIPLSYCAPWGSQQAVLILNMKKKMPRDNSMLLPGIPGNPPGHGGLRPGEPDINTSVALNMNNMNNGKGRITNSRDGCSHY